MTRTRRQFIAEALGAAALAACPAVATAAAASPLSAWLAVQDIGPVYYVHARVSGLSAGLCQQALEEALGHPMRAMICYGERGGETLYAIVLQNDTKMDLAELPDTGEPSIAITFRGANGTAEYHA